MTRDETRHATMEEMEFAIYGLRGPETIGSMTVPELLTTAGELRGGSFDLYNPGLAISFYEHDDIRHSMACSCVVWSPLTGSTVFVTACKGCPVDAPRDEIVLTTPAMYGGDCVRRSVLAAIILLMKSGAA